MESQTQYWKSLDQKYNTPEFQALLENEFQSSPLKLEDGKDGLARRQFMKLMGASVALSATACVRRPVQKIIPYNKRPGEVVIGIPNYYASSFFVDNEGFPVTIKTREGRPLHIETLGTDLFGRRGLSVRASAQILSLYDPDRVQKPTINSQDPKKRGNKLSVGRDWETVDNKVVQQLKKGGVRFLLKGTASPTLKGLIDNFSRTFQAPVTYWSPCNAGDLRRAQQDCYGDDLIPRYRYDRAEVIVSVDADFLGSYLNASESSSLFAKNRNPESGQMSRLFSFHSVPSLTSYNADDNWAIKPSQQLPLVLGMIHELLFVQNQSRFAGDDGIKAVTEPHHKIHLALGMSHEDFAGIVKQLWDAKGKSVVVAGGLATKTKDAYALQVAVNLLNSALENDGSTVLHQDPLNGIAGSDRELGQLLADIKDKKVKTLIIDEINPAYSLPLAKSFKELLGEIEMVVSLANWMDETASLADIVAPQGHPMENWGDLELNKGVVSISQPTIQPLWSTRSFGDSLLVWAKLLGQPLSASDDFYNHLKSNWLSKIGGEKQWYEALERGFIGQPTFFSPSPRDFNRSAFTGLRVSDLGKTTELVLYTKVAVGDGSFANNSWLQELPDPVSKVCWDNYLHMHPRTAKGFGLKEGDLVEIKAEGHAMELPVLISPTTHPEVVAVAIGYGRALGGKVVEKVGFNTTPYISWHENNLIYAGAGVEIRKPENCVHYPLANTQGHHSLEGRQLIGEANLGYYKGHGDVGIHKHHIFSIWGQHSYEGHKWGMAIDLNSCTGCSVCMIACQSENNIPVVGKKYILHGREMHWIRIDRYFNGDENGNPDTVFQPVTCQHCENAPCETVCPVLATVHSDEGLNDMVYNRCVGTRYCSNNCPYKVRRFNWFYYDSHHKRYPSHMALNPEVTVRTRGVMEKCTFCVQRIKDGKSIAKDENRPLRDGDIKTACQVACPTDAITFGDLNDPESKVAKAFKTKREYTLLEEFNAAPRVRYLAKIRNTDRVIVTGMHGGGGHGDSHKDNHDTGEHGTAEQHGHSHDGGH